MLEFYLPAQTPGARRELLVVAERFNGYDYPVLRLSLRISSGPYHLYINVTEEDVGRGYVVWDFDITEFSNATGGYNFKLIVDYKWFGLKANEDYVGQ